MNFRTHKNRAENHFAIPCMAEPPCLTSHRGPHLRVPEHVQHRIAESDVPWQPTPSNEPGWRNTTTLTHRSAWETIITNYQRAQRFPSTAPAAACGLQHYAGRYLAAHLSIWANSGMVLTPDHTAWYAHIDQTGATTAVACPTLPVIQHGDAADVTDAAITHLTPLVTACRSTSPITEKVAWGCIAASFAGSFGNIYASVPTTDQPHVYAAAQTAHQILANLVGKPLLHWRLRTNPNHLEHDRITCCLMRLAHHKDECAACPDIPKTTPPNPHPRRVYRHWPITWSVA